MKSRKFSINLKHVTYIVMVAVIIVMASSVTSNYFGSLYTKLTTLTEENADLTAANTVLEAKVENLENVKASLLVYANALVKGSKDKDKYMVSRGAIPPSDSTLIDRETYAKIHRFEIENGALRKFYENTTGNTIKEIREVNIESTMYTNAEGAWAADSPSYGMMASGKQTYEGAVAAPSNVPFGSTVLFEDSALPFNVAGKVFTVGDRGGAIKDKGWGICIDIWTDDLAQAKIWGRNKGTSGYLIIPND